MKKTYVAMMIVTVVVITLSLTLSLSAQVERENQHHPMAKMEKDEVVCPVTNRVMKMADAPASYTLYFASEAAKEAFLNNPARYLTATCPVMGGEANKLTAPYSDYDGVAYYFCCDGCKGKFDAEPKKYIGMAPPKSEANAPSDAMGMGATASGPACEASAVKGTCGAASASCAATCPAMKAQASLVTDPVCGMQFAPEDGIKTAYRGTEYQFCSEQCKEKFEKDPGKYTKK
jgi:YHS domain-containing protein